MQLKPDAKPFHSKPYAVPNVHLGTFKKELDRLVEVGVLVPTGASLWAAGTFIIPKKDGTVRWVSDFRQLNKYIDRLQYPLPRIQEIVQQQKPYKFFTKIDVSMQYYTFRLDRQSSDYCTIVTPFEKSRYTSLPMGVCQSSDFAQATMEEVLRGLSNVTVYIDDIKITHDNWEEHIQCVKEVLYRLRINDLLTTQTSANGVFLKRISLVFGLRRLVQNLGAKRLTASCPCLLQRVALMSAHSVVPSHFTAICSVIALLSFLTLLSWQAIMSNSNGDPNSKPLLSK